MADAIGMIEVEGVAGIIVGADAACKAAAVELLGWESIGGFTTVFVRGPVGDVATALSHGEAAARQISGHVVAAALDRPRPECAGFVGLPVAGGGDDGMAPPALGLIETRGYGAHVDANDRMVKAADVAIAGVLTVHNRVVCTLVTGAVDAVEQAIEAARHVVAGSEWFLASAVISQPTAAVVRAFAGSRPGGGAS